MVLLRILLLWLDTNTSPPIRVIATVEKYTFPNQVNAIFLSTEENIVVQHNGDIICRVSKTLILMNNKNVMSHCRGLTRATYILCIERRRASAAQKRRSAARRIRNLGLYYYSSPPSCDVASSWSGIVAEFDSDADIFDWTRGGPNSPRGSKALEPQKAAWELDHVGVTTM
jgi:hypothetical protein